MRNLALDFGGRDGLDGRPGGGSNLRPGLSGLPARMGTGQLLRMPLYVAGSVQPVGIRTRGAVHDQSIFRQRASAGGASIPAVSPGLLS